MIEKSWLTAQSMHHSKNIAKGSPIALVLIFSVYACAGVYACAYVDVYACIF